MVTVDLGVVGCGAVAQYYHLPAARKVKEINVVAVADKNLWRAERVSQQYHIPNCMKDYPELFDLVDGVLIALPHRLHSPVSIDFLRHSIPVLCEKPMATSTIEAEKMLKASRKYDAPLAVGLVRRFYRSSRLVKQILSKGLLGRLDYFKFEEGQVYNWPTKSGFFFDRQASGGGVLMDTGAYVIDLLLWWLGNDVVDFEYRDDSFGGVEANCKLDLTINYQGEEVAGQIELSRTRNLRNLYVIVGENGKVMFSPTDSESVRLFAREKCLKNFRSLMVLEMDEKNLLDYPADQLRNFADVVLGKTTPYVSGEEGYKSVKLIENCYRNRERLSLPWVTSNLNL